MAGVGRYADHFSDDDDDDNDIPDNIKTSVELAQHDRALLNEEEEQDRLLMRKRNNGEVKRGLLGKWQRSNNAQTDSGLEYVEEEDSRSGANGRREFLYKIEDDGSRASTPSSTVSDLEKERVRGGRQRKKPSRRSRMSRCCKILFINTLIVAAFVAIALGAFRASHPAAKWASKPHKNIELVNNGTSFFAPTTILISLDGFRADFLDRGRTPVLNSFVRQGVSPEYMLPSFPSVTFPNHFTLVTGLYPESHGVVGNTFWDPDLKEEFYYTHQEVSMQPKWWHAEPLWVTAEDQGFQTAIHMWPGSEAHLGDVEPTFLDKFNSTEELHRKSYRILELLDLPGPMEHLGGPQRPQLIAAYVPNVDQDGHLYGPNSTEILNTLEYVDSMLDTLFKGLEQRNLTEIVNIIIVSDHGMASTSIDRIIQFEDLIDPDKIEHIEGWPNYGLRPKNEKDLQGLYIELKEKASNRDGFDVYLRDSDMPRRYHFSNNNRIAPLWIMPHTQWAIVTQDEFDLAKAHANNEAYHPRGIHGYDNEHPLMRSIFAARGPAFPHLPGSKIEIFQNIEVYNILCDSLGIEPNLNNGTLRLPFQPIGLHSSSQEQPHETISSMQPEQMFGIQTARPDPPHVIVPGQSTPDPLPHDADATSPAGSNDEQPDSANKSLWDWMLENIKNVEDWAGKQLEGVKSWASGLGNNADHNETVAEQDPIST